MPGHLAFSPFFPALVGVAVLCQMRVAIGFVIVSAFLGAYFWGIEASDYVRAEGAFVYAVFAMVVLALAGGLKDAHNQIALRDEQLSTINSELTHRIRNLFQVANVIVSQSIRKVPGSENIEDTIARRFSALGAAQSIAQLGDGDASLGRLVEVTLGCLAPQRDRLLVSGPLMTISPRAMTMLALVLHELGTNALKYGAWSDPKGVVRVQWGQDRGKLTLSWAEHGGPPILQPTKAGAGSKLIRGAISDAAVDYRLEPQGAALRTFFPPRPNPRFWSEFLCFLNNAVSQISIFFFAEPACEVRKKADSRSAEESYFILDKQARRKSDRLEGRLHSIFFFGEGVEPPITTLNRTSIHYSFERHGFGPDREGNLIPKSLCLQRFQRTLWPVPPLASWLRSPGCCGGLPTYCQKSHDWQSGRCFGTSE